MVTSTESSMVSHQGRKHISALGRDSSFCRTPGSSIMVSKQLRVTQSVDRHYIVVVDSTSPTNWLTDGWWKLLAPCDPPIGMTVNFDSPRLALKKSVSQLLSQPYCFLEFEPLVLAGAKMRALYQSRVVYRIYGLSANHFIDKVRRHSLHAWCTCHMLYSTWEK